MRTGRMCGAIAVIALAGTTVSTANAAMLETGFYALHNHPDGNEALPYYGLRLDGLDGDTSHEFTFDFDYTSMAFDSAMWLTLTEPAPGVYNIRIEGQTWGGEDDDSGGYAANAYEGIYTVVFEYTIGGQLAAPDDDILVAPENIANKGTIVDPLGVTHYLTDFQGGNAFSFRFGDENNDLGHRGFNGISGWGWLAHGLVEGQERHISSSDWLFTAEKSDVPTPGALSLAGVGLFVASRRRRR